jgi:peptide/nickel transport system permease protein
MNSKIEFESKQEKFKLKRSVPTLPAPLTPSQLVWRRFRRHQAALVGGVGLAIVVLYIVIGSIVITEKKANEVFLTARLQAPTADHWFGTDSTGRDQFARIIYGGQISLVIGLLAVALEVTFGALIGSVAAYYGGWVDSFLMRFTEAMLSIPSLFLLIVIGKYLGRDMQTITFLGRTFSGSVGVVILVIGLTAWMPLARIVRATVLSLREMDYISASRSLGASNGRILLSHLLPNCLGPLIVAATLGMANAIITEAYVSFLGLGVQPPTATWGNMMTSSISFIQRGSWWMWTIPSFFIVYVILCVNLVGDGLRDALDPRTMKKSG